MSMQAVNRIEALPLDPGRAGPLLEAQKQVLELIVQGKPLAEVLEALCLIVEAQAERTVRAGIMLADADEKQLWVGAAPSLPESYRQAANGLKIALDSSTCAAAAARREAVVTVDIARDPGW